jgi:hypothetical protein
VSRSVSEPPFLTDNGHQRAFVLTFGVYEHIIISQHVKIYIIIDDFSGFLIYFQTIQAVLKKYEKKNKQ